MPVVFVLILPSRKAITTISAPGPRVEDLFIGVPYKPLSLEFQTVLYILKILEVLR
jgi:hypothetical protein